MERKTHAPFPKCARVSGTCLILALLCVALSTPVSGAKPKRVAIVGAGIGGATTAYFIDKSAKHADQEYEVHIFEKNERVGGRIRSFSVFDEVPATDAAANQEDKANVKHKVVENSEKESGGKKMVEKKFWFELGAAVWAAPNLLLDDLAHELSLDIYKSDENAGGEEMGMLVYEGGPHKQFYELALGDISNPHTLRTAAQMEKFKVHLLQNYLEFLPRDYGLMRQIEEHKYQPRLNKVPVGRTKPWQDIGEWAKHGHIDYFTSSTTREYLHQYGVSHNFTDYHIEPLTRVIYDQGAEANAFAGFAALVSSDQIRVASHGLQSMVSKLVATSGAVLHLNSPITTITRTANGHSQGNFGITIGNNPELEFFDIIVLTAPLEFLDIKFVHLPHIPTVERRQYVGKTSTYVRAKALNHRYFGTPATTTALLTNAQSDHHGVGFFSIVPHHRFHNGDYLFKVFSRQSMANIPGSLENWFENGKILESEEWAYTFPELQPPKRYSSASHCETPEQPLSNKRINDFQPIVLEKDIYYTSAIDSIAVAMEASTLSAQNIAHMIVFGERHKDLKLDPHAPAGQTSTSPRASSNVLQQRTFTQSEIIRFLRGYLPLDSLPIPAEEIAHILMLPATTFLDFARIQVSWGDVYLLGYVALGIVYGASDLLWIRPRFNSFYPLALLCIGHTIGYWLEVLVAPIATEVVGEVHAHATLFPGEALAGVLVALGTWVGDAVLPLAMLARTVVRLDKWTGAGAIAAVVAWPTLSDSILSVIALVSRSFGGPSPSLSLLDVNMSTAVIVSAILILTGIIAAAFSHQSLKSSLLIAPILSLSHIGYLFSKEFLGTTSEWTRIIPSHVASYLYQDGLAAIVDPISSTQTLILIVVPLFLIGSHTGYLLTKLAPPSTETTPKAPRFPGLARFFGGFILVIGLAIHSGSFVFLTSFYASLHILSLF
jgi:prenylcysteine oxidase/farnesylcysteine lyase